MERDPVMAEYWTAAENGVMMRRCIERHIIPENISRGEYGLLGAARILGPRPITILAKRMLRVNSDITYLLDKLIEKGYAEKVRSSEDARVFNVVLTDDGVELADRMIAGRDRMAAAYLSELDTDDKEILSTAVLKVKSRIDQLSDIHPDDMTELELSDITSERIFVPERYELLL